MKEKKYALYGIGVILISLIGISLAYFATQIVGKEKDISVNTKDLRIIFNNGDAITGENVVAEDNWSMTKTFSVENKSNSTYKYNIVIKDLINTFKTTGYLQYKITSTDGGYNMTSFEDVPKRSTATDTVLAYNISIEAGVTQNYTITIQYPNDANIDQSDDMGAELSGKLFISEGSNPTLTYAILRDNPTISERTNFSTTNVANTTRTIYQTNKTEDGSTVYYYSGNTTNNWVKFGKETEIECTYYDENTERNSQVWYAEVDENTNVESYRKVRTNEECSSTNVCKGLLGSGINYQYIVGLTEAQCKSISGTLKTDKATSGTIKNNDIYWRIIRTNEDGSIRLLYSGTDYNKTTGYIGISEYNANNSDPNYTGYMYGNTGSLVNNRTNINDSTIKTFIDKWYKNNLLANYDKYVSKTAIYCNDRSNTNYSISNDFNFGSYIRLSRENNHIPVPTYKCGGNDNGGLFESTQAIADKFSVSTTGGGNGRLTYPIAIMTTDEIAFAGGVSNTKLEKPYTWYVTNGKGYVLINNFYMHTMSPSIYNIDNYIGASVWIIVGVSGNMAYLTDNKNVTYNGAVRPVLSLNNCAKVLSGIGTPDNPYVVDYENSCN